MRFLPRRIFFISLMIIFQTHAKGLRKVGIIGGDDASENTYTYTVSLQYEGINVCGGGIIGDRWILTAAHCVINDKGAFYRKLLSAVIGAVDTSNLPDNAMIILIETIYAHVKYRPQDENKTEGHTARGDIAVLKLRESMRLDKNPHLTKLTFSWSSILDVPGRKAIFTGYGYNEVEIYEDALGQVHERGRSYGKMRYVEATIISKSKCQDEMAGQVHNSQICARVTQRDKNKPEGVCTVDSGGPLVRSGNIVIGILSVSPIGCSEVEGNGMGIYTRVTSYKTFIKDAMKGNPNPHTRVANWYNFDEQCGYVLPYLKEEGRPTDTEDSDDSSEGGIYF